MTILTEVDYDPFAAPAKPAATAKPAGVRMTEVEGDPFAEAAPPQGPQEPNIARKGSLGPGGIGFKPVESGMPMASLAQGVLTPWVDEAIAGVRAPVTALREGMSVSDAYDQQKANLDARLAAEGERHPVLAPAAEVGGAVASAFLPVMRGVQGARSAVGAVQGGRRVIEGLKATGKAAGAGAVYGGVTTAGVGDTAEERLANAETGAKIGAVAGPVGRVVGSTVGRVLKRKPNAPNQTTEELGQISRDAYQEASQAGVFFRPGGVQQALDKAMRELEGKGFVPEEHTTIASSLRAIEATLERKGGRVDLQDVDVLRQLAANGFDSPKAKERMFAGMIREKIDDFVENAGDADMMVTAGDADAARAAMAKGRQFWARMRKSELLDEMETRAKLRTSNFTQSGRENAMRTEFRQLAMAMTRDKPLRNRFTKEERAAINHVVQGGKVENAMRRLGRYAPTSPLAAATGGGIGATLGGMLGGPMGAVLGFGIPTAGLLGRAAATRGTQRNVNELEALIRRGEHLPQRNLSPYQVGGAGLGVTGTVPFAGEEQLPLEADEALRRALGLSE